MEKVTVYSAFGLIALLYIFKSANSLDCSGIVKEESHGVLNWLADVNLVVPVKTDKTGWTIMLTFDQAFTGIGVWDVWVEHGNSTERWAKMTNRDFNAELNANQDLFFRFRINYGVDIPKPQPTSLKFQNIELCR